MQNCNHSASPFWAKIVYFLANILPKYKQIYATIGTMVVSFCTYKEEIRDISAFIRTLQDAKLLIYFIFFLSSDWGLQFIK